MAVDEATGDLYVAETGTITKVALDETRTQFATGFSKIFGLDVYHPPGTEFGVVLVADNTTNTVKLIPVDNSTAAPTTLASGTFVRSVAFSRSTHVADAWSTTLNNRLTYAHNTGGTNGGRIALRAAPVLNVDLNEQPVHVWISAPSQDDTPGDWQGDVRKSFGASTNDYSTFKVKAWWPDRKARDLCAALGDAPSLAPYEPRPTSVKCGVPWQDPQGGVCDNNENFDANGGVGTSKEDGDLDECEQGCGASWAEACEFEFRVSQQNAGDNYLLYLYQDGTTDYLGSALVTAWKREYIENDKMCRLGGMLYADPGKDPDAEEGEFQLKIAKEYLLGSWVRRDSDLESYVNQVIHVFDTVNTFEAAHDWAYICDPVSDVAGEPYITVTLGTEPGAGCLGHPYYLQHDYNSSVPHPTTGEWDFNPEPFQGSTHPGRGGGVCVELGLGPDFYETDPSELNNREHRTGTFDDAFVSFTLPRAGGGVVPFLEPDWFQLHVAEPVDWARFSQLWFHNKREDPGDPSNNQAQNYFHLIGATSSPGAYGVTFQSPDVSFVLTQRIEEACGASIEPAPNLNACIANFVVDITGHEIAHQLFVNEFGECVDDPEDRAGHDPLDPEFGPSNLAWCSGEPGCVDPNPVMTQARCLMSGATDTEEGRQMRDSVHRMECEDLGAFDPEPPNPCDLPDCGFGLRGEEDPQ